MFHVCFMYVSDFWFIFQFLVVRIAGLSESLKAQRTLKTLKEEGYVRIAGLSESLKAQRTLKTLKEEGICQNCGIV